MNADVFVLTDSHGALLPPSVQATVLAKYSRSPESARELVAKISAEESEKFHDKYTISYGHSSVAELAVVPLCFEGVSMVTSKFIESFQRPGYSEKSTRYQKFSSENCVDPTGGSLRPHFDLAFQAYETSYEPMITIAAKKFGLDPQDPEVRRMAKVKARAFDALRYLLPTGCATNVAAVMNMRDVRYLVQAARGSDNPEIRSIGEKALEAASFMCPALIKDPPVDDFEPRVVEAHDEPFPELPVYLVNHSLPHAKRFYHDIQKMYGMDEAAFNEHMNKRGPRAVPSIFKKYRTEFHIMMDFGAYRDLQRHRRCEQWAEPLTANFGYSMPADVVDTDIESRFEVVFDTYAEYYKTLFREHGHLAQYVLPMGFNHRSTFEMDAKELYYFVELRTRPQGHISYREIAWQMFREAKKVAPEIMKWCQAVEPFSIGEHH